jgi:predicted secreted protein
MNEHLYQLFYVLVGALLAALPSTFRNWRSQAKQEGVESHVTQTILKDLGALQLQLRDLGEDLNAVAEANRKRFERLEKKGVALEQAVTGKMPRISGEGPTNA